MEIIDENNIHQKEVRVPKKGSVVIIPLLVGLLAGFVGGVAGSRWSELSSGETQLSQTPQAQNITITEDSAVIDVVKKASPAVVSIVGEKMVSGRQFLGEIDPFFEFFGLPKQRPQQNPSSKPRLQQVSAGSGFFVTSDGLVMTNKHVVDDETTQYKIVTNDKRSLSAKVVAIDPVNDLAILKVEGSNFPTLSLAEGEINIGQRVVAIGFSLGQYQNTVTTGVVSGIGRSITAGNSGESEQLEGVIQTDTAINPGNSGGPLLNVTGQVLGINTAIDREGQLIGFAIPASDAKFALDSFKKNGAIKRAYLGVRYVLLDKELAEEQKLPKDYGALIIRGETQMDLAVQPGSPADKAGLVENDIILEVNGVKIDETHSLAGVLRKYSPAEKINLKVYHKGEEKQVEVVLEAR